MLVELMVLQPGHDFAVPVPTRVPAKIAAFIVFGDKEQKAWGNQKALEWVQRKAPWRSRRRSFL